MLEDGEKYLLTRIGHRSDTVGRVIVCDGFQTPIMRRGESVCPTPDDIGRSPWQSISSVYPDPFGERLVTLGWMGRIH